MDARQNDHGFTLRLLITEDGTTGLNISTAPTKQIILRSPSDGYTVNAADFTTDGTDGFIEYTVPEGVLNKPGRWKVYAKVVMPSGLNVRSTGVDLQVESAPN